MSLFPFISYLFAMKWWGRITSWAMILVFWMLSFKPASSLSSFIFIRRLFSSSSLSAIRVVSSACLKLLIFLPAILILAWTSPILAFHRMYSAYKLNKQSDNIQPWHTPFSTLNLSVVPCSNCCFLSCIQVSQETGNLLNIEQYFVFFVF